MPSAVSADPISVATRLRPVLFKLNRELRREIHSLGVTGGQASLLIEIQRLPGMGVGELATRERMSVPGMSKYVGRLESAGLIRKTELADRRRVGIELTEEGHRVLASAAVGLMEPVGAVAVVSASRVKVRKNGLVPA